MRILYGLCSWGLGHATRSLPILRALLDDDHEITIYTCGRALTLLKRELGDRCDYIDGVGYPAPYVRGNRGFAAKFVSFLPAIGVAMRREHNDVRRIVEERGIKLIVGDGKYGLFHERVPSYLLLHQLRFIAPGRISLLELITEYFQYRLHRKFRRYIVPDFEQEDRSLSGDLSRNLRLFKDDQIRYIGVLSDFHRVDVEPDIDYLISVSGPEPSRTTFENKALEQSRDLDGRVVMVLGKPERSEVVQNGNVEVHSYIAGEERVRLMNRARFVVSRSGYSTLMDLAELDKRALFIPTPGQTEQEYLARYHRERGTFHAVSQRTMDLKRDIEDALAYRGVTCPHRTAVSVDNFMNVVFG